MKSYCISLFLLCFFLSSTAFAIPYSPSTTTSDDPMDSPWPMKCHDLHHTGRSPYNVADTSLVEKWRYQAYGWVEGGPVIDREGTIYFGDFRGYLFAIYPDGTDKWNIKLDGTIWSTPTLAEDGTIYIGTYGDTIYAINPDGTEKWHHSVHGSISSSPAIGNDGTIYFGTMGWADDGDCNIYAVNPDGSEKWHYHTDDKITSDPAIGDDGTIYMGSGDNYLYAVNPDGSLKWRYQTGDWIKSHPSIAKDGTIYFISFDGYFYALYPNGTLKWKINKTGSGNVAAVIAEDGTLYLAGGNLYAINPDGTLKWSFDFGEDRYANMASPAISVDGTIFAGVWIGDGSGGELIAVNPDGTERWRSEIIGDEWIDSSPCIGSDGTVYIGSSYDMGIGYLHAFNVGEPNNPPDKPTITGPHQGKPNVDHDFIVSCSDPEDQRVYYQIQWGDGSISGWIGPYDSDEQVTVSHLWYEKGSYEIIVQAKDYFDMRSEETTMEITIPKSRSSYLHDLLEGWIHRLSSIHLFFDKTLQNEVTPLNSTKKMEVCEDNLDLLFWQTPQVKHHILSKRTHLLS